MTMRDERQLTSRGDIIPVILAMLPDTGERCLSMALLEGIAEGSDPEP
jgi:hypothetical protein